MNKRMLLILIMLLFMLASCKNIAENTCPTIEGVNSIECIVNSTVDILNGVIAYDEEEGDITPKMNITISPFVEVTDGYVIFEQAGNYKINYEVTDSGGLCYEKASDVVVIARDEYINFKASNGFYTTVGGHAVLEQGGMYNNEYSIKATGSEIAEDIALNRVYDLIIGKEHTFTYYLSSETEGNVYVQVDGKLLDIKKINAGDNEISFKYLPNTKSSVTISLLLGELGENVKCIFKNTKMEYLQDPGWEEMDLNPLNYTDVVTSRCEPNGESQIITDEGSITLEVTKALDANWKIGAFINTFIPTSIGQKFEISFKVQRENTSPCEIAIQNSQWDEKKYIDNIYVDGNELITTHVVQFEVTEYNQKDLWIYMQSGMNQNKITLSELKIRRFLPANIIKYYDVVDFTHFNVLNNSIFETFAGGFKVNFESFIQKDYEQKVMSPFFEVNGSVSNYVVSFKAKSDKPIEVVLVGWGGVLWHRFTISEIERVYTFSTNSKEGNINGNFEWQFGSSNNQKYNNVTIEISDIIISYKNSEYDGD